VIITLHGIPNCDTVKRARGWLDGRGVAFEFHDFKRSGVPPGVLDAALQQLGWESVLNRRGSTWRKLDPAKQAVDAAGARELMLAQPSVIKRPLMRWADGTLSVGFDADDWARRV
jgi:Spx/MgsR family transcriptional regulator